MEKYLEVQWYGRAGQGVMTSAALLAEVLAMEGKYVQAVPDFTGQKNNMVSQAFNRLSDSPLKLHSAIDAADIVAIMDPTLILNTNTDIKTNIKKNSVYIVNTPAKPGLIKEKLVVPDNQIFTLDSAAIISEQIFNGSIIPNVPLITVLIHWIDWISIEAFKQRLHQRLSLLLTTDQVLSNMKSVDSVAEEFKKSNSTELKSIINQWES